MAPTTSIRVAAVAGLIVVSWLLPHTPAIGAGLPVDDGAQSVRVAAGDVSARAVDLGVGKSVVIDLPHDIKDVLVADPKIANAVVRSTRRAYIIGVSVGQTNVFFFDADGHQMAGYNIAVTRDLNGLREAIRKVIPDADISVEGIGTDGIILTGTAANQAEAQQAYDLAVRLLKDSSSITVGQGSKVVNAIVVRDQDEIMLKVTVAEVSRDVIKQLGVNLSGSLGYGAAVVNFNSTNGFPINGAPTSSATGSFKGMTATLQAMEQAGVVHTLAEPTLTAISGESAHFLAGGMFPYPTPPTSVGGVSGISFQNFGVSLTFTPVVLSGGRISLNMLTEVSELDPANSVTVAGTTVPGLTVRRADTTVEIPSGGSLAVAGMIEDQTKQDITGLPGLLEVPILGTLFKSRDYLNNRTELVILVTPYVVHAVAQKDLSQPDDGFADPSDPATVLLGRLNRIYGVGGTADPTPDNYHGKYGFILD